MRRVCAILLVGMLASILATAVSAANPPTPVPITMVVEGTVTNVTVVTPSSGSITVMVPSPTPTTPVRLVTFAVTDKTQLYKDGKKVSLGDIKVGDGCRALVTKTSTGDLVALIVYAKTIPPPPLKWAAGVISDKALWNGIRTFKLRTPDGALPLWFSVDGKTKITLNGQAATYDQLANGQAAEVGYVPPPPTMTPVVLPILASVVNAKTAPPPPLIHYIGRLLNIDPTNGLITVAAPLAGAAPMVFKITPDTKINKFGPAGLGDLVPASPAYVGDLLDVLAKPSADAATPPVAVSVVVIPETASGIVASVNLQFNVIMLNIRTVTSPIVTTIDPILGVPFRVDPLRTKIVKNGVIVPLSSMLKGDLANIKFFKFRSPGSTELFNLASLVEARSPLPIATTQTTMR